MVTSCLSGPTLEPAAGGAARQLVVLLHGLGADGDDLLSLGQEWQSLLPHAAFLSPHAPDPCELAPMGFQWFSLRDFSPAAMVAGIRAAAPLLRSYIEAELAARRLGFDRLALVGFSQGTMMALQVGLRLPEPCAAIVGYSGALPDETGLPAEIASRPKILLVHGLADSVVPVGMTQMAAASLQALEVPVTMELRPGLDHGIDARGAGLGGSFLAAAFGQVG
jgi:phospholipase/carboxylesterase